MLNIPENIEKSQDQLIRDGKKVCVSIKKTLAADDEAEMKVSPQ